MDFVFEIKKEFFILEPLDDSAAKNPRESLSLNGPENGENASDSVRGMGTRLR